ncbi:MAG: ACP S-malonyltransferase [Clostridia bacterium]|nr:ACP S-malonyltransferase [Clostridia bacterium]
MKASIVFAGQGAQTPGMGKELYEAYPTAQAVFAEATDVYRRVTGCDTTLEKICFEYEKDELDKTANSQPAIFTLSMAGLAVVREKFPQLEIASAAGFSLGECSALCAAGVLDFASTMELILLRGDAMGKACAATDGMMCAVIGVDASVCEAVCAELANGGVLLPVNYNCPGQTVIAGERALVEQAAAKLKEQGAMKVVPLAVQGAFHTPLMNTGRDSFVPAIEKFNYAAPSLKLYTDVTGAPIDTVTPAHLGAQMTSPVRWQTIIENMLADGTELFIEFGPGRVLSGLIKRISRTAKIVNIESPEGIEKLASML